MRHSRCCRKRYLTLAIALSLFATGLTLSCGRGGGDGSGSTLADSDANPGTGTVTITGHLLGATASAPTPATPDHVKMTVRNTAISMNDLPDDYKDIVSSAVDVDFGLDGASFSDGASFESQSDVPAGTYRALRLTVSDLSWHASWSTDYRSPCDAAISSGEAIGSVNPGGHKEFYFKTPDLGGNTLSYYLAHPPLSGYVGDANHPFVMASPIQVIKDLPTTVNLVIGVANTLTCDSVTIYSRNSFLTGGKGQLIGNTVSAAGLSVLDQDTLILRLNGDTVDRTIIFTSADNGTDIASQIQTQVQAFSTIVDPSLQSAYSDFTASFDGSTNQYTLTSGAPGLNSSVVVTGGTKADDFKLTESTGAVRIDAPLRTVTGPATRLTGAEGIYFDSYNQEVGITNSGNNSVTVYNREAIKDTADNPPTRILIGPDTRLNDPAGIALYADPLDSTQREIVVANTGNDSVTTYSRTASDNAKPLRTITGTVTGLSGPTGIALYLDQSIPRDPTNDEIVVTNSGNNSVTIYGRTASENTPPYRTIQGDLHTGLSHPCGLYVDPVNQEIGVANSGNGTVTIFNRTDKGDVPPKQTITGLSTPCGLYVDTKNDEIGVADSGNGTVSIYKRLSTGEYLLDRTIAGLNGPRALYLDTTRDEIGAVHKGESVAMAQPPSIFPVSANEDASFSALANGYSYNVTLYGVDIKGVDGDGNTIPFVFAERGIATFDASATPWPGFSLTLNQQIGRRVSTTDCLIGAGVGDKQSGFYGVNHDGSFYAFLPGIHGSLQGAFLPDGSVFVGSMVDHSKKMMLVYGVKTVKPSSTGSSSSYLTSDGSLTGSGAHYAFTTYRNSPLNYLLWIGMAATDVSFLNSMSGDANILTSDGRLRYSQDDPYLRVRGSQSYKSNPGGILDKLPPDSVSGAVTADGSTLIFARDTITNDNGCPTDIGFGMGLRQSPAGTFTTSSIKGTYFVAAFGDRYELDKKASLHRSTAARLNFDGAGSVEITTIENAEGRISVDRSSFTYQVRPRGIPSQGDTLLKVDVVDIFDRTSVGPYATALIGRDGMSLGFYRNLNPGIVDYTAPNPTRLLGLAVFQHP